MIILGELQGHLVELCMSRYGRFAVQAMLRSGTREVRNTIALELMPHTFRLLRHAVAAPVLDTLYTVYSSVPVQRGLEAQLWGAALGASREWGVASAGSKRQQRKLELAKKAAAAGADDKGKANAPASKEAVLAPVVCGKDLGETSSTGEGGGVSMPIKYHMRASCVSFPRAVILFGISPSYVDSFSHTRRARRWRGGLHLRSLSIPGSAGCTLSVCHAAPSIVIGAVLVLPTSSAACFLVFMLACFMRSLSCFVLCAGATVASDLAGQGSPARALLYRARARAEHHRQLAAARRRGRCPQGPRPHPVS